MPHVSDTGGDLGANDEVKVFNEEGEEENDKRSSENLAEDKNCLTVIAESEGRDEASYVVLFHQLRQKN